MTTNSVQARALAGPRPSGFGLVLKPGGWIVLKRGIAFSVSGVLAMLVLTSALPPLIADQTDRAVVDAPVTLLTATTDGEVQSFEGRPGQHMTAGTPVVSVTNNKVDRTTLITLQSKQNDTQEALRAARAKRQSDVDYLAALTKEIDQQTATIEVQDEEQIAELQARLDAAGAAAAEKKAIYGYQTDLVQRNVAAPTMARTTSQQYAGAKFAQVGSLAKLRQKQNELDSARKGIFVGEDVHDLAVLVQKKRDMELDVQRLDIEATQLQSALDAHQSLLDAERQRLDRLSASTITAPGNGEIISVGASVGRHVNAGDTLARMVDCQSSFIVAIFSYRQGADVAPGSRMQIDAGPDGSQVGTVIEVLPKTSDKVDEAYALPFPQTERRELYVLIKPDSPLRRAVADDAADRCDIGRWVTITRLGGWIPSTSVFWHDAGKKLMSGLDATLGAIPAAAEAINRSLVGHSHTAQAPIEQREAANDPSPYGRLGQ